MWVFIYLSPFFPLKFFWLYSFHNKIFCKPTKWIDGINAQNSYWLDVSTLAESFTKAKWQHNQHDQVTECIISSEVEIHAWGRKLLFSRTTWFTSHTVKERVVLYGNIKSCFSQLKTHLTTACFFKLMPTVFKALIRRAPTFWTSSTSL